MGASAAVAIPAFKKDLRVSSKPKPWENPVALVSVTSSSVSDEQEVAYADQTSIHHKFLSNNGKKFIFMN